MAGDKWRRVTREKPCPICGRADWCLVSVDGTAAICPRVESDRRVGDAGFLHRLHEWRRQPALPRVRSISLPPGPRVDLANLAAHYQSTVNPDHLDGLARHLGLSVASLRAMGIGWSGRAWSFPMVNVAGNILGIRLRFLDGRKLAVKGGNEGLFIPHAVFGSPHHRLLVTEGPTDCAALLDMGFAAVVGRPSCGGGIKLLVNLVQKWKPREAVIVADSDGPGQRGADNLASILAVYVKVVKVIRPPDNIKDARAWLQTGGTQRDVEKAIHAAPSRRLAIKRREEIRGR